VFEKTKQNKVVFAYKKIARIQTKKLRHICISWAYRRYGNSTIFEIFYH